MSRSVSRTEDKGTRGLVGDAANQWWLLHEHSREGSRGKQQSDSCENLVSVFFFPGGICSNYLWGIFKKTV